MRWELFEQAGRAASSTWPSGTTSRATRSVLPREHRHLRGVRERHGARHRDGRLDQHGAPPPRHRPRGGRRLHDGGHRSALAQGAEHLQGRALVALPRRGRAPRGRRLHHPGRARPGRASSTATRGRCTRRRWARPSTANDVRRTTSTAAARKRALAAPGGVRTKVAFSQDKYFAEPDADAAQGLHPRRRARLQHGRRPGRALRQHRARRAAS